MKLDWSGAVAGGSAILDSRYAVPAMAKKASNHSMKRNRRWRQRKPRRGVDLARGLALVERGEDALGLAPGFGFGLRLAGARRVGWGMRRRASRATVEPGRAP